MNLNSAVAGLKMAHLLEITVAFEFAVIALTVSGLRFRKYQNPLCFRVSAPFSSSLTAEFRMKVLLVVPKIAMKDQSIVSRSLFWLALAMPWRC
jgi:hypothetical protein